MPTDTLSIPTDILSNFGGQLVDHRVEFRKYLQPNSHLKMRSGAEFYIEIYPQSPAADELLDLGMVAGNYSRFQTDQNIPRERFESLYRLWMDRSTKRELADIVFIARLEGKIVGVVTASIKTTAAKLDLLQCIRTIAAGA